MKTINELYKEHDRDLFFGPADIAIPSHVSYAMRRSVSRSVLMPPLRIYVDEAFFPAALAELLIDATAEIELAMSIHGDTNSVKETTVGAQTVTTTAGARSGSTSHGQRTDTRLIGAVHGTEVTSSDDDVTTDEESFSRSGGPYVEPVKKRTYQAGDKTVERSDDQHTDQSTYGGYTEGTTQAGYTDTQTHGARTTTEQESVNIRQHVDLMREGESKVFAILRRCLTEAIAQSDPVVG